FILAAIFMDHVVNFIAIFTRFDALDMALAEEKIYFFLLTAGVLFLLKWLIVDASFSLMHRHTAAPMMRTFVTILLYFGAGLFLLNKLLGINIFALFTTSAVLTGIIALSLQETMKNLFTGVWINTERIVGKGDWVKIGDREGEIMEVTWRTTLMRTREMDYITIPNRLLAERVLENYTHPLPLHMVVVDVGAGHDDPPDRVRDVLLEVAAACPQVLRDPKPDVLVLNFGESSVNYRLRAWINDYGAAPLVKSELTRRMWYALRRNHITIPYPVRTVYNRPYKGGHAGDSVMAALNAIPFLGILKEDELLKVAAASKIEVFGEGETIVRQGDLGDSFYLIQSGGAYVFVKDALGRDRFITGFKAGGFFGEMSLLTGEPRKATVVAKEDTVCIVVGGRAFHSIFRENPELSETISSLMAKRTAELEEVKGRDASKEDAEHGIQKDILRKIKYFFKIGH
ncbi:MAG: mechanosensitive ion channel, partial [Deltaproteobacteria bacterium]|nr:mechanosensitive ion channel [Deltaproteobacteria bacterium]